MAVPQWINEWWPEFYTSLAEKEAVTPIPLIMSALEGYRSFNRESDLTTFYTNTYGYCVMSKMYGLDPSVINNFNSRNLYNVDGFVQSTLARPADYYTETPNPESGEPSLEQQDADFILQAATIESALVRSVSSLGLGTVRRFQVKMLFEDVPITGELINKEIMGDLYFNQLNWKYVHVALNTGSITNPPYIEYP